MGSSAIGNLSVSLTLNTAAFQKGATLAEKRAQALSTKMAGIGNSLKGIGVGLAAGVSAGAVAGLAAIAKNAFEMGSALTEAAGKVGVTVEALQEMRYVAEQNGTSIETMEGSLNKMTKTLGSLQMGNKGASETFKALGISAQQMVGLSPTDSFIKIVDALGKIEDETVRAALGNQIFGRSYAELKNVVDLGADGIRKAAEEKRKDGVLSTAQAATLDDLADGWDKLTGKLGVAAAQFIANRAGSVNASKGLDQFGKSIGNLLTDLQNLLSWLDKAELALLKLSRFQAKMQRDGIGGFFSDSIRQQGQANINRAEERMQQLTGQKSNGRVKGTGRTPIKALPASGAGGVLAGTMSGAGAGALATLEKLEKKAATVDAKVAAPIKKALDKVNAALEKLRDEAEPLIDRLFPEVRALLDFEADQNTLAAWAKAGKIDTDKLTVSLNRLRDSYYGTEGGAFTKDGGDLIENITDSLPDLADLTNRMTGKIKKNTEEIGDSFEDSANRVVNSIGFMAQSIKGGGFLGILEGISGLFLSLGSVGAFGSKIAGNINGKRARGGSVTSNRSYLVGERGPEMLTMGGRGGFITPNNKLGDGGRRSMKIEIRPTPYFDAVVDQRAANIAAPMAGRAAMAGSQIAQQSISKRQRNRIP